MLVRCVKRFKDLQAGTYREVGATFEVDDERYHAINNARYGQLVEKVDEKPAEAVTMPEKATPETAAPKRRGRPKKTVETE